MKKVAPYSRAALLRAVAPGMVFAIIAVLGPVAGCLGSSAQSPVDAGSGVDASTEAGPAAAGDASADAGSPPGAVVTTAGATVVVSGASATTAPPTAYGQNYWSWVTQYGDQVQQVQSGASAMGLNVLRAGGHNNDINAPEPFDDAQVDLFVAYARATGAQPILQVPLLADTTGNRPTPQTAAAMVTYANVTKQYGIKYWEIGNEPDLYSDQGNLPAGYTAASYCTDFAAFADAMRAVDPTIKILGPELSYKYVAGNDWLTPFLAGCAAKVDIVSVHRYPFDAADSTLANAMNDSPQFRATVKRLRATLDSMGLSATPLAITESNFSYQGDPTLQTGAAALGTFYAGLWVADATGVALEQGLWSIAFWSLDEGFDTGFFTSDTFQPRPAAYAYELVSTHFGPSILHAVTVPVGLSAYASRDDAARKSIVLLINRTAAASSQVVGFSNLSVTLPSWAVDLPAYSLTLVELPDDGSRPATWRYTKDMADQSVPPQMQ